MAATISDNHLSARPRYKKKAQKHLITTLGKEIEFHIELTHLVTQSHSYSHSLSLSLA